MCGTTKTCCFTESEEGEGGLIDCVLFMLHLVSEEQPLVVPASYHYMKLLIVPTEAKTKSILRWIGDDYFDTYNQNTKFKSFRGDLLRFKFNMFQQNLYE